MLLLLFHQRVEIEKQCVCVAVPNVVCAFIIPRSIKMIFNENISLISKIRRRLPFDWRNPCGYLAAITFQYIAAAFTFLAASNTLSMGIGTFILQLAMIRDVRYSLYDIHSNATTTAAENGRQALKQISTFVEFHLLIKQLSGSGCGRFCSNSLIFLASSISFVQHSVEFYRPIFLGVFVYSTATICGTMLSYQVELVEYWRFFPTLA